MSSIIVYNCLISSNYEKHILVYLAKTLLHKSDDQLYFSQDQQVQQCMTSWIMSFVILKLLLLSITNHVNHQCCFFLFF